MTSAQYRKLIATARAATAKEEERSLLEKLCIAVRADRAASRRRKAVPVIVH